MRKKYKRKKSFFDRFSYSTRNTNIFLACILLFLICGLSIGYSLLSNVLSIKSDLAVRPYKDIRITAVTGPTLSGGAYEQTNFRYSHDLLIVNGVLPSTSSSLTYKVTVTNNGSSDMDLINIISTCNNSNIYYELVGISIGDMISADSSITFEVVIKTKSGSNSPFNDQLQFVFEPSYIDITAPVITFDPVPTDEWSKTDYSVLIKAVDDVEVTTLKYCISSSGECTPTIVVNKTGKEVTSDAIKIDTSSKTNTICAIAADSPKSGTPNSKTLCSNYDSKYYKLDKVAPTINPTIAGTTGSNSYYKSNVAIVVNGTDTLSEYKGHKYQISENNGTSYGSLSDYTTDNISLTKECTNYKVKITGYDNALNNSTTYTSPTIKIDKTAPVVTVNGHTSNFDVTIDKGSLTSYTLPTGSATDNCNGSVSVTTSGSVNTSVVGTYIVKYTATDSAGNSKTLTMTVNVVDSNPTVGQAIYYNPVDNKICSESKYNTSYSLNEYKGESDQGNGEGCMKWYIIGRNDNNVNLILDHNTTYKVAWNSSGSNSGGPVTVNEKLASDVSGWSNEAKNTARLITADEVWSITSSTNGQSNWSSSTSTNSFYFEGSQLSGTGTSKYAWLFDYTNRCTRYGCNKSDIETNGYWTSSPYAGSSRYAWSVHYTGSLGGNGVSNTNYGVRPVISLDNSVLINSKVIIDFDKDGGVYNEKIDVTMTVTEQFSDNTVLTCLSTSGEECTPTETLVGTNKTFNLTNDGKYKICAQVSGNGAIHKVCSDVYTIDTGAPTINPNISGTTGNNGWYKSNVTVNVNGSDDVSGYKGHRYQLSTDNGTNYGSLSDFTTSSIVLGTECVNNKLKITGYDNALNTSATYTSPTIKIDKTAPVITVNGHTSDFNIYVSKTTPAAPEYTTLADEIDEILYNGTSDGSIIEVQDNTSGFNRYLFSGTFSNNYITFGGYLWRIIGTELDSGGSYTSFKLALIVPDTFRSYDALEETLTAMEQYFQAEDEDGNIVPYDFYNVVSSQTESAYVGLLNSEEYISLINNDTSSYIFDIYNQYNDYAVSDLGYQDNNVAFFTQNQDSDGRYSILISGVNTHVDHSYSINNGQGAVLPVINVKADTKLYKAVDGDGSADTPFQIVDESELPSTGSSYTVPSGTANDNCGGTRNVTTSGSVNTNVIGKYPIRYTASDEAGNVSTLTATVNVVNSNPILQSWASGATTDFHSSTYKTKIKTVTFTNSNTPPSSAIASWDVSASKDGSVKAWVVTNSSNSSMYDLYIGGDGGVIANENSAYIFSGFTGLTDVDVSKLDISNATNMSSMFANCSNLTTLDLNNFKNSKVTNTSYMFNGCTNLTSLEIRNLSFNLVTNNTSMFYNTGKSSTKVYTSDVVSQDWIRSLSNVNNILDDNVLSPEPPANFTPNGGTHNNSVDLKLKISDWYKNPSYLYCLSTTGEDCTPNITGTGTSKTFNLNDPGTYKVCVTVTDSGASNYNGGPYTTCSGKYTLDFEYWEKYNPATLYTWEKHNVQTSGGYSAGAAYGSALNTTNYAVSTNSNAYTEGSASCASSDVYYGARSSTTFSYWNEYPCTANYDLEFYGQGHVCVFSEGYKTFYKCGCNSDGYVVKQGSVFGQIGQIAVGGEFVHPSYAEGYPYYNCVEGADGYAMVVSGASTMNPSVCGSDTAFRYFSGGVARLTCQVQSYTKGSATQTNVLATYNAHANISTCSSKSNIWSRAKTAYSWKKYHCNNSSSSSMGSTNYGDVTSYDQTAYPENGEQDGYWYLLKSSTSESKGSSTGEIVKGASGDYPDDGYQDGYYYVKVTSPSSPTISMSEVGTAGYGYYSKLAVNFTVKSTVNITNVSYCLTTADTCTPNITYSSSNSKTISGTLDFPSNSSGQKLCVKATNSSGEMKTECSNIKYKVDKSAPTGTATANYTRNSMQLEIDATGLTDAESGIYSYEYYYGQDESDINIKLCDTTTSAKCTGTVSGVYYSYLPPYYKVIATNKAGLTKEITGTAIQYGREYYYNPVTGEKSCTGYTASNSLNQNKTGCMKWYIVGGDATTVNLLLDHNTTYYSAWNSSGSNTSGPTTANSRLASDVSSWASEAKSSARLITVDEVWNITKSTNGLSNWDSSTATSGNYFEGVLKSGVGTSAYPWLFDYTNTCTSYGCNTADTGTWGYWTSSPNINTSYAWRVDYGGGFGINPVNSTDYGIRPVITITLNSST